MLLHVHCKKTDQLNMIEIVEEYVGDNQATLQNIWHVLRTLKIHLELQISIKNENRKTNFQFLM